MGEWEKRLVAKHWEQIYIDKLIDFYNEYPNPKAINISILFNGALTCLFCLYFKICTKEFCIRDFDKIELFDEWRLPYNV